MGCKEGKTPLSTIEFGCSIKIRSIQDDEFSRSCVRSDINCCDPYDMVSDSIWGPSGDVISSHHHDLDRALKSPSINKNVPFSCLAWFKSFSKFTRKLSNSVADWFGEQ